MSHRFLLTLTLLLCVALAGCGGTTAPTTETATSSTVPTDAPTTDAQPPTTDTTPTYPAPTMATANASDGVAPDTVVVSGGELPFDANVTYERVQNLLGVEGERPPSVSVREPSDIRLLTGENALGQFETALGVTGSPDGVGIAGFASGDSVVLYVYPNDTAASIEQTLAHEFAHVLLGTPGSNVDPNYPTTTDTRETRGSIAEGAATYTESVYTERYLPGVASHSAGLSDSYDEASPAVKLFLARYHYGARYVDQHVDSPQNLSNVYDTPPWSTEQILHGYPRDVEARPPVPTAVVNTSWSNGERVGDTRGELFTRVVLGTALNDSVAASAAAGWEGDTQLTLRDGANRSHVWTLYWENETEADEFAAAADRYVENRTDDPDTPPIRVERTSARSVTVVVGQERFVESVSVRVEDGTVYVDSPEGYD